MAQAVAFDRTNGNGGGKRACSTRGLALFINRTGPLTNLSYFMENIAQHRAIFRDRGIPNEAVFEHLEKSTVQNEAFNRIRGMLARYSQVSVSSLAPSTPTRFAQRTVYYIRSFPLSMSLFVAPLPGRFWLEGTLEKFLVYITSHDILYEMRKLCCIKRKLYRSCIEEMEKNVEQLEQKLDKVNRTMLLT